MTQTTTKTRKPRQAPQAVHGFARWVGGKPTQGMLDHGDAVLQITADGKEASFFFVGENKDNDGRRLGFRLIKIDGLLETATYDVEITAHGVRCDCPDALYCDRPGEAAGCGCKHAKGLPAALAAAKLLN
jgi:hypothetical protein